MPKQHNMGWRKPVPRLTPEPSINSPRPSRSGLRRLSMNIVNKDMPPLPVDWRESIDTALKRQKRHAMYFSPPSPPPSLPPSLPPKDSTESLVTLVEEQRDVTLVRLSLRICSRVCELTPGACRAAACSRMSVGHRTTTAS
ncbi:hypothetical protein TRAPUB_5194 [Trametes pubescens]|uniref:Uncharacterized protein n=1 Tax=Trametes pubescens TaxID=154538 RepID=A0A1M2V9C1_TRAPU|nr:hypothetical protein TRAPUB_5194 [Trametes pubescens]